MSAPYLLALIEHAVIGSDETRAALLALVVPDRVDADEALRTLGEIIERAADGWLAPDPLPPAPDHRPKTLRGRAPVVSIVGADVGTTCTRADSDDLLKRADEWLLADVGHTPEDGPTVFPGLPSRTGPAPDHVITPSLALLGTDVWSWSEVINPPAESHAREWLTMGGLPIGLALSAHRMGDSVTTEARKRRPYRARRATYARGLSVDKRGKIRGGAEYVTPCSPMIAHGWAHVVELTTRLDGAQWVGHRQTRRPAAVSGRWVRVPIYAPRVVATRDDGSPTDDARFIRRYHVRSSVVAYRWVWQATTSTTTTRVARAAARAKVAMSRRTVATVEALQTDVAAFLAPAWQGADTGRVTWTLDDGTRVTVAPEPALRRVKVRVSVINPDGTRKASSTTVRSAKAVAAAIANRVS